MVASRGAEHLSDLAFLRGARRLSEAPLEEAREGGDAGVAGVETRLRDRPPGGEQRVRVLQAELGDVLMRRHAEPRAERAMQMEGRQAGFACGVFQGQRRVE